MKELLQFNSKAKGQETRKAMRKIIQARQASQEASQIDFKRGLDSEGYHGMDSLEKSITGQTRPTRIKLVQESRVILEDSVTILITPRLVTDQALLESNTTRGKMYRLLNDIRRPGILDKIKNKFTIRRK
jgi:hypothetical protein